MRLFQVLCRYRNTPNGNIYIGKRRIVKPVTFGDIQKLRNQLEIEEQNMFYLRHPYLTPVCTIFKIAHYFLFTLAISKNIFCINLEQAFLSNKIQSESMYSHLWKLNILISSSRFAPRWATCLLTNFLYLKCDKLLHIT